MTPITLLPGLACDAELWRDQVPALSAMRPVQVSDVHTRCTALPQMAEALLAEQAGEVILCGTSMGGMLALEVQRQAPQRVRALALLASSARPDTPELIQLQNRIIKSFPEVESVYGKAGRAVTATDPAPSGRARPAVR